MDHAYRDRPLDELELEVLRLVLSTFRDGGGQVVRKTGTMLAGPALVDLVGSWHKAVEASVDVVSSRYSVLSHDASWSQFQMLAFPLDLRIANPIGEVEWRIEGASLNGYCSAAGGRRHRLWQVYMSSGGQMKYYPLLSWADWTTQPFQLAVPPLGSLIEKASNYFGDIWPPEWS